MALFLVNTMTTLAVDTLSAGHLERGLLEASPEVPTPTNATDGATNLLHTVVPCWSMDCSWYLPVGINYTPT